MTTLNLVALDVGAESGRAMMGCFDGQRLALEEVHRFPNRPVSVLNHIYWDVLSLFAEIKTGLGLAAHQNGGDIASLGLDTWGVDFGLLGDNDILLGNPLHYRDHHTEGMMETAFQRVPREEIFRQTGIQFMQLNSIYQLLAMNIQSDPTLPQARTLLMMPDLFNFWLSGHKVCEFTEATTSQLYDPRAGVWARELMDRLSIPNHIFPQIVPPGTVLGSLLPSVGEEVGLSDVHVVAPATHDTGSAVAAVPMRQREGAVYISCGTWSLFGVEMTQPIINDRALAENFTNEGGVEGTFRFLKNISGLWLVSESRRIWARQGADYTYDDLANMAATAPSLRSLVDPDDPLLFAPADMPDAIRQCCRRAGEPLPESKGEIVRCALESLAMAFRRTLEGLESVLGQKMKVIHIVGGGSRNRLLCQFTANATGLPVVAGPAEATATGNLLVQALALKQLGSLTDIREVVRRSFDLAHYEPNDAEIWQTAYGRWLKTYKE